MPNVEKDRRNRIGTGQSFKPGTNTTAAKIPWRGVQIVASTQASKSYRLGSPIPAKGGALVTIACQKATTTNTAWVTLPAGWFFQRTSNSTGATHRKAVFNAGNQTLTLQPISTSRVAIIANVNTVSIGTS